MDKVNEILSDPESLKQIQELANMLNSEVGDTQPPETNQTTPTNDFDISKVLQLMQLLNQSSNSKDTALLLAIKPYLTAERQPKVDKAIKLLKAYDVFTLAKSNGLLSSLDSII
jgi:hypothetical protein